MSRLIHPCVRVRGWSAKLSLFMRVAFPSLARFVSSRRQNRIRRDRVVQCSVYNSGSLHQLLNLLLRKKERKKEGEKEGRKEEGKTDSGKSIFLPLSLHPANHPYPARPPARIIMFML